MLAIYSSLFHAVGLVFQQRTGEAVCTEMRQAVASGIRANSTDYPDVVLGMPREQYVAKMLDPKTWGGAIEVRSIDSRNTLDGHPAVGLTITDFEHTALGTLSSLLD